MALFKQVILKSDKQHRLKTLHYKIFAIGGYITKNGNQKLLQLPVAMKRRKWIEDTWKNTQNFSSPFVPT